MTSAAYLRRIERSNGQRRRVGATQTRTHIERLTARGWTQYQIAAAAGIDQGTVSNVACGRYLKVARPTATAVLAIRLDQAPPIPRYYVDATGTRRRLQALTVLGYALPDFVCLIGVNESSLYAIAAGNRATVRTTTAAGTARLYRRLSTVPAPESQHAAQARAFAAERGWHGPMAWDDIDDPACQPETDELSAARQARVEDVAELAEQGLSSRQIADRLGISQRTVDRARATYRTVMEVAS